MTWWAWVLVFLAVAAGGAVFLFLLLSSLWRKASSLFGEIGSVSDRLAEVLARLDAADVPDGAEPAPEPAVFANPAELRGRAARRSHRHART